MAIKSLEQKKQQKNLLFIAAAILIVAGLILYFGFWKGGAAPKEAFLEEESATLDYKQKTNPALEERLKKVELNLSFLKETILPFLKSYGELPVEKGITGRANPFIPY